jgi:hypothetical protein
MSAQHIAGPVFLTVILLAAALAYAGAAAAPDDAFRMARAVVGAGGVHAPGSGFVLDSTAGQPAAGPAAGATVDVTAGFWGAPPPGLAHHIYLPGR